MSGYIDIIYSMISILMPIKNGIEFIDESVSSIKEQIYEDWELIIGINGHNPDSEVFEIAKKYEDDKIRVIHIPDCTSKSYALNQMVKEAKYEWISLLDVDDKWKPTKLVFQEMYMKEYDIIGTCAQYFGDMTSTPTLPMGDLQEFNFFSYNPVINSSCLLKKELCYWDKTWDSIEDYDLWLKLWKQGKKFYNVPSIEVYHRIHKQSAFNAKGNHLLVDELKRRYV